MDLAIKYKTKFFVETSVLNTGYDKFIKNTFKYDIMNFPSCTLYFHPCYKTNR